VLPLRAQLRITVLVLMCALDGARPAAVDPGRGCDVAAYYAPADLGASGAELTMQLHSLVATPHTVIPYTHATKTDTWDALRDLDADPADPTKVILIYAQRAEPADSQGVAAGWNREHVWPKSFGVRCCLFPLLCARRGRHVASAAAQPPARGELRAACAAARNHLLFYFAQDPSRLTRA